MKVGIVQEVVDVTRGGAETSTVELARHLATLGADVTILHRSDVAEAFAEHRVRFHPIIVNRRTRFGKAVDFVKGVHAHCRLANFDIVHAISPCLSADVYQPRGGTYAETVARTLARTPTMWRWAKRIGRLFNLRQRLLMRLEQLLLTRYGSRVWVAAVSEYVRRQVRAIGSVPDDRVKVIFNGVDIPPATTDERAQLRTQLRNELGLNKQAPTLLFVAHNFALKGLATLIHALARGDAQWTLLVAGRDRANRYARLARRLGMASRVHFIGASHSVRSLYAAADALAHPTWYDPCSRVVLEALSVGLPVVTTRYNGAAEVMIAGRQGFIIDQPGAADELAAAIEQTLAPEVRAACAADAERMHPLLSMRRHAQELLTLYESVLAERRPKESPPSS